MLDGRTKEAGDIDQITQWLAKLCSNVYLRSRLRNSTATSRVSELFRLLHTLCWLHDRKKDYAYVIRVSGISAVWSTDN